MILRYEQQQKREIKNLKDILSNSIYLHNGLFLHIVAPIRTENNLSAKIWNIRTSSSRDNCVWRADLISCDTIFDCSECNFASSTQLLPKLGLPRSLPKLVMSCTDYWLVCHRFHHDALLRRCGHRIAAIPVNRWVGEILLISWFVLPPTWGWRFPLFSYILMRHQAEDSPFSPVSWLIRSPTLRWRFSLFSCILTCLVSNIRLEISPTLGWRCFLTCLASHIRLKIPPFLLYPDEACIPH